MGNKNLQVRIDEKLRQNVEEILKRIGIDPPTAVRMFFKKIEITGGIPFDLRDDDTERYSPEEWKKIEEAYKESFDEKNLIGPFDSMEEALQELNKKA